MGCMVTVPEFLCPLLHALLLPLPVEAIFAGNGDEGVVVADTAAADSSTAAHLHTKDFCHNLDLVPFEPYLSPDRKLSHRIRNPTCY